jgi:hypothetical protein
MKYEIVRSTVSTKYVVKVQHDDSKSFCDYYPVLPIFRLLQLSPLELDQINDTIIKYKFKQPL